MALQGAKCCAGSPAADAEMTQMQRLARVCLPRRRFVTLQRLQRELSLKMKMQIQVHFYHKDTEGTEKRQIECREIRHKGSKAQ